MVRPWARLHQQRPRHRKGITSADSAQAATALAVEPLLARHSSAEGRLERRRVWTDEQKLALVEATLAPGANVAEIARRADLRPSQIYRWRRHLLEPAPERPVSFAPVVVAAETPAIPSSAVTPSSSAALNIELEGAVVRITADAPRALVSAVLKGLKR